MKRDMTDGDQIDLIDENMKQARALDAIADMRAANGLTRLFDAIQRFVRSAPCEETRP